MLCLSEWRLQGRLEGAEAGGSAVSSKAGLVSAGEARVRGQTSKCVNSPSQTTVKILLYLVVLQFLQDKMQ